MQDILKHELLKYNPNFTESDIEKGLEFFKIKSFKAKEIILQEGKVSDYLFFADKSISRCYYTDENGEEQTLWMKPGQTFITEFKSFVYQQPSGFNLQFYEDTDAYCIKRNDLLSLYSSNNNWALFGIHLTESLHVILIDVFVNLLANDATKNYQYIEYMFPRFIQVAPLKDIASMLQVTPVTLSRIRGGTQTKN